MNRSFLSAVSVVLCLFPLALTVGQNRRLESHLSLSAFLGATWEGPNRWEFNIISRTGSTAPIVPGIGFGIGVEYGPLAKYEGSTLTPSVEVSFGHEYAKLKLSNGSTIEAEIQRIPILASAKIMSESNLSPFLRIGIGAAITDYRQTSPNGQGPNIRFHEWHFLWAIGGGLNYQLSDKLALELFLDDWISEKDIVADNPHSFNDGIHGRFGLSAVGLRGVVSL
jgi:opacity protein-like surface antigen